MVASVVAGASAALEEVPLAVVELAVLWGCIVLTIIYFSRISRTAAWLMVPYLAWVSFAAVLTYAVWQRNPGLLA